MEIGYQEQDRYTTIIFTKQIFYMLSFWSMSDQGRSWRSLFTFTVIIYWKDWCWSWSSNTLATWCYELTHWKRPWCWERLKAGGEGDNRGWDGLMASPIRWTWVWASSRSWWRTGKAGVPQPMGSQKSWTQLNNWTELNWFYIQH